MKRVILIVGLMIDLAASTATVVPRHADVNLHYLDLAYQPSTACPAGQIQVNGPRFVENGRNQEGLSGLDERPTSKNDGISNRVNTFCISASELAKEREWAKSVYQTRVATGTKNQGTSFLVADNIILTNHHIAVPLPANPYDCRSLEVLTRAGTPRWVGCKKILYCNAKHEFCFVEMKEVSAGVNLGNLSRPLPLNARSLERQSAYLIGNSYLRGIQGSKGPIKLDRKRLLPGEFAHLIPMVGGSSGSPILNDSGEVIGINHSHMSSTRAQLRSLIDPDGTNWNVATSAEFMLRDLSNRGIFSPVSPLSNTLELFDLLNLFKIR